MLVNLRDQAARQVLRGLHIAGMEIVGRARSMHNSDCSSSCEGQTEPHSILRCRCIRVLRLRVHSAGDWLLLFGDRQENQIVQLQGPYDKDAKLSYGGGFWHKVEV